jgi:hypothetical protein
MAKYKLVADRGRTISIIKQEDIPANTRVGIPLDPANTDYQEYLEWVEAGNTAEAAD